MLFVLNHRVIIRGILFYFGVSIENSSSFLRILDKKEKLSKEKFQEELDFYLPKDRKKEFEEFLTKKSSIIFEELEIIAQFIRQKDSDFHLLFCNALLELKSIAKILQNTIGDKKFVLDLSIVRGLEYYTGIIFETTLLDYKELGSICSGGRYDNLASYFWETKITGGWIFYWYFSFISSSL